MQSKGFKNILADIGIINGGRAYASETLNERMKNSEETIPFLIQKFNKSQIDPVRLPKKFRMAKNI